MQYFWQTVNDISKEYDFPPLLRRWKNDIVYDNTKPDIVISVIFTQNEDLFIMYWNIE